MENIERRQFLKLGLVSSAGLVVGSLFAFSSGKEKIEVLEYNDLLKYDLGYVVDTTRCIGCRACEAQCPASAIKVSD